MSKSSLDSILSQYEKNSDNNSSKPKISNEERLKKYFTEKLQKGVKNATRTFRILPGKDGESPFAEAYFHERQVNGKYEKLYCPKLNEGDHCPLCEAREALLMEGSKKAKDMARDYSPRKYYVVKGIDRDNEDHGVKFWRYKHKYTGDGVQDKLMPIFKLKGDITAAREGRDIIITTNRNDKGWSVVSSIMADDVTLLTENTAYANDWINNEETFKDVYAKKPLEYLEIVAKNMSPVWDSELSKYVAEEEKEESETASLEEEINFLREDTTPSTNGTNTEGDEGVLVEDLNDDETDDFPF